MLVADARASYAEIGAKVSLSAPAVKRRVDRLRSGGVIKGFTAVVDPTAVGWTTEAFIELFCTGRTTPAQIAAAYGVDALHAALTAADSSYRSSAPVLRLSRLMADLDFRSRAVEGLGPLAETLGPVQRELELVDGDIAQRYFGGAAAPVARLATA